MVPSKWRILIWRRAAPGQRVCVREGIVCKSTCVRRRKLFLCCCNRMSSRRDKGCGTGIGRRHGDDMGYHLQAIGDNALVFPFHVHGSRDCCVEPRLVAPNITQRHAMLHASAFQGCGRCSCLSCHPCRHRCAFRPRMHLMRIQVHGSGMAQGKPHKAAIGIRKRCSCTLRWQRIRL